MKPIALVLLALLAGCATPVARRTQDLDSAAVCCARFAQFQYVPLPVGKSQVVTLGSGKPVFQFDSGKSYFYAAHLPDRTAPLALTIESEATTLGAEFRGKEAHVLRPEALLLDGDFRISRRLQHTQFRRNRGANLIGTIFINPENAAERYLVVYANSGAETAGGSVRTFTPSTFSLGGPPITLNGAEEMTQVVFTPTGRLTIELQSDAQSAATG